MDASLEKSEVDQKLALPDVTIIGNESKSGGGLVRIVPIKKSPDLGHVGFNLTRSHLDPYPWVKSVDAESAAGRAGLRNGDCLLKVNGEDLLGKSINEVARLVKCPGESVELIVWSADIGADWDPDALVCGPLPSALRQLSEVVSAVLSAMECPVCSCTVRPPAALCPRGHLICANCRSTLSSCPLCRASLQPSLRNLLADQVYNTVVETFELKEDKVKGKLTDNLFGKVKITKYDSAHNIDESADEFFNDRRVKWGRHKLLQRLLPGKARSTENIARASSSPTRNNLHSDDLSRSLSNLDIAGYRETHRSVNSLSSLACTAGGSCASLPPNSISLRGSDVNLPEFAETQRHVSFNCPADRDCDAVVNDNVEEHVLKEHKKRIVLETDEDTHVETDGDFRAIFHPNGHWFYPKCETDDSGKGVRVWCWCKDTEDVSSQYQLGVEVWSENAELEKDAFPLIKLASPIMSLQKASWKKIFSSKQALFLGHRILKNDAKIRIRIDRL